MPSLLYIDHSYHNKTKSTQFLQEMFRTRYDVTTFDYDPYEDSNDVYAALPGKNFDVVVCFQILPDRKILNERISFTHGVFFPMFDGAPDRNDTVWKDYSDFQIINFSKTLHEELTRMGLSSRYIQYFPKPVENAGDGDARSIFFWQRMDRVNIHTVEQLFPDIEHVHLHKALDPGHRFTKPSASMRDKTSISEWFPERGDLYEKMEESALYLAPREYEGIGMSFLEAMAMGRCVIAVNHPTMNEYIRHGETGYLYDLHNIDPLRYSLEDIVRIQQNTLEYIRKGYAEWQEKKWQILDWLEEERTADAVQLEKWFKKPQNRTRFFIFGLPVAEQYRRDGEKEFYSISKKIPFIRIRKNAARWTFDFCKINIFKIK